MRDRQARPGSTNRTAADSCIAPGRQTLVGTTYGDVASTAPMRLQTKLSVGRPGDAYEQEADRVADQVVSSSGTVTQAISTGITPLAQRQTADSEEPTVVEATLTGTAVPNSADLSSSPPNKADLSSSPPTTSSDEVHVAAKEQPGQTTRGTADLADQVASSRGGGEALSEKDRAFFEQRMGQTFGGVRIHADADAAGMSQRLGARAFTHGQDVYFGAGEFQPNSPDGKHLLAHELTHVVQQTRGGGGLEGTVQRQGKDKPNPKPKNEGYLIRVPAKAPGQPKEFLAATLQQAFRVSGSSAQAMVNSGWGWATDWPGPSAADVQRGYVDVLIETSVFNRTSDALKPGEERDIDGRSVGAAMREKAFSQLPASERVGLTQETNQLFWQRTNYKVGQRLGESPQDQQQAKLWIATRDEVLANREKVRALPNEIKSVMGGERGIVPKDYEKALRIAEKLKQLDPKDRAMFQLQGLSTDLDALDTALDKQARAPNEAGEPPKELERLLQVLKDRVKDPQFADAKGMSWLKFAKFLDRSKGKIEGIFRGNPPGRVTEGKIAQIIAEYGKFIATEPAAGEEPNKLETQEEFDKKFKYDPGWQKLSKADRKLLIEYAKLSPEEASQGKIDFARVTTDMKVSMALKLSWKSWPGEVAEAAKNAFSDPGFLITLVLIIAVYVGLWLTPDPTMVTKIAAGVLTVALLAQFAWEDIYGLAKAWMTLQSECSAAASVGALQAAGDRFAKKVGQVGFDILMAIAMWGMGRAAGPRISKVGAERATGRATAEVAVAEGQPGSGVAKVATGEALQSLETAKARAQAKTEAGAEPTDTGVLDALGDTFKETGRSEAASGLTDFRGKLGDTTARKALEGRLRKGEDLAHFLAEQAMTPEARAGARANVESAKIRLARAKLIEMRINEDPHLRKRVTTDTENVAAELEAKKIGAHDEAGFRKVVDGYDVTELVGDLGEAIGRADLKADPANAGRQVLANMEIVREVPGYKTIAQWKAAQQAAGKPADVGGLYEAGGKLWKSITEVDNMVVEKGPGGKLRVVEIEQVKVGSTNAAAVAQNTKAMSGLTEIQGGKPDVQIFDRVAKNQLGNQRTAEFDLSDASQIQQKTRGVTQGFDRRVGYMKETLEGLARQLLIEGLPDRWHPASPRPPTGPRGDQKDQQP